MIDALVNFIIQQINASLTDTIANIMPSILLLVIDPIFTILNTIISTIANILLQIAASFVNQILFQLIVTREVFDMYRFTDEIYNTTKVVAASLFILILVFQLLKSMSNYLGYEAEEPWKIGLRALLFGFFLMYSKEICFIGLDVFSVYFLEFKKININPDFIFAPVNNITDFFKNFSGPAVIILILDLYIAFKLVLLVFKFAERRMISIFLILVSPLAMACGVSKSTKVYLNGWLKGFIGSLLVQLFQFIIFIAIMKFKNFETASGANIMYLKTITDTIILISMLKLLDKVEELIRDAGLTVGAAIGPVGDVFTAANSLSSTIFAVERIQGIMGVGAGADRSVNPSMLQSKK